MVRPWGHICHLVIGASLQALCMKAVVQPVSVEQELCKVGVFEQSRPQSTTTVIGNIVCLSGHAPEIADSVEAGNWLLVPRHA